MVAVVALGIVEGRVIFIPNGEKALGKVKFKLFEAFKAFEVVKGICAVGCGIGNV